MPFESSFVTVYNLDDERKFICFIYIRQKGLDS